MLNIKFFNKIGPNVRDRYRTHIFRKAKDINDKPFKPYTSKKYSERKQAGKFKRFTKADKLTAPVLTGDMLRDYGMIGSPKSTGFTIGWSIFGARVEWLKKLGRVLTTPKKPLPDKVLKYLTTEASKFIKKETNKFIPNKITKHKIGK